ncbi:MAG TPA: hypothetical protein PLT87_03590 [Spirochaetales bacterium]|nr:hypothetical protein [Spirochaetales bacterium]
MKRKTVPQTVQLLNRGIKALGQHRPDKAVNFFRSATESVEATKPVELAKTLYWLAVALQQMGQSDLALKSLASAQKLQRRGYARKLYVRATNQYGMLKRSCQDLDDFFAFMHLQLAKYLSKRPGHRFTSLEEHEAVMATLFDAWKSIQSSGFLEGQTCAEKVLYFRNLRLAFPVVNEGMLVRPRCTRGAENFDGSASSRSNSVEEVLSGPCPCGSGLPYLQCCGRIKSVREMR